MLEPTLDALAFLHEKGFAHCRLKPSNIQVVDDQLKLSVENIRRSSALTRPPDTLDIYDAPERARGEVSPACDIWSLGAVLVEALTQIAPLWDRESTIDPKVPPSVPAPFKQIAQECLRIDPDLRCTPGEIRMCLQAKAPIPHRTADKVLKPSRKRPVAILASCAVVLLAAIAVLMVRSHQTAPAPQQMALPARNLRPQAGYSSGSGSGSGADSGAKTGFSVSNSGASGPTSAADGPGIQCSRPCGQWQGRPSSYAGSPGKGHEHHSWHSSSEHQAQCGRKRHGQRCIYCIAGAEQIFRESGARSSALMEIYACRGKWTGRCQCVAAEICVPSIGN